MSIEGLDPFNVSDGYKMPVITLPTLPVNSLLGFLVNEDLRELASDLWYLTYDSELVDNGDTPLTKMTNSKYNLLRESVISGFKKPENGVKKKATKDTLEIILNQSVFGRTGGLIRLAHSGFSVMLKPIDANERISLQHLIATNVINLHRDLTGDMYTGIYITIHEAIIDLFISKIDYTTLDLEKRADIKKYIKVKDLGLIQLAILDMIYPTGYDFNYICGELIVDDNKESICSNTSETHRLGMRELLYIADDLTDKQYEQLMTDTAKSISIVKVREYQDNFKYNQPATFKLMDNTFTIDPGYVDSFINKSKEWLKSSIIENPMFKSGSDIEILKVLINMTKVGMYYYTIAKVENDTYETAGNNTITTQHINILSTRDDIATLFIEAAKGALSYSYYQLGAPKYTCPTCVELKNKAVVETEKEDSWNNASSLETLDIEEEVDELQTHTEKVEQVKEEPQIDKDIIDVAKLPNNKDIYTNINLLDLFSLLV